MITDSIANASIPMPAPKDFAKKKRGNRTAKLKQCKLDARREQWLSQVKKKGCREENAQAVHVSSEGKKTEMNNLEIKTEDARNEEPIHHFSDSDSASNSPNSSFISSNISGTNFTASSTSGSSSGSFSGSITGEDEEDCLDDWEALADALTLADQKLKDDKLKPELELTNQAVESPKPKQELVEKTKMPPTGGRAWKPDDAFRPQSLPNLAKQKSFPLGRNYFCKSVVAAAPTSCPICCEDLDFTDSSFHPCGCGFRLCLFCHKRILEEDGRCPGCRKPYEHEGETTFRLARSCSMITRF